MSVNGNAYVDGKSTFIQDLRVVDKSMNVGHGWGYLSMAAKNSNILIFRTMPPCVRVSLKGRINLEHSYLSYILATEFAN